MSELKTAKEKVLEVHPTAVARIYLYEEATRDVRCHVIQRPQPGSEKDYVDNLSNGCAATEAEAWQDAWQRIESSKPIEQAPAVGEQGGVELIASERARQIAVEGWTPEYDNSQDIGILAVAACAYAEHAVNQVMGYKQCAIPQWWPWLISWWKPSPDPIRNLVKAGALIAAEIDRLQRAHTKKESAR